MSAADRLIGAAEKEIGYLEKKTPSQLDDKTANAGSNNFTKYWRDIYPVFQGQPWCACFVTWCFVRAFGKEKAARLLRHYPYVYCPNMTSLFKLNANPKRGDIVIFYRGGAFAHTGIVTRVSGGYFETVEGNTSAGNAIIPNGGAVCRKGYMTSEIAGTKFVTPDWSIAEEDLTLTQYEELKHEINKITPMVYDYMDENMPAWAKPTIQKLMDKGALAGDERGRLGLTMDIIRTLTVNDRMGLYD